MFQLQQKKFLKLLDLSPEEITGLLDLAPLKLPPTISV